MQLSTPKAWTEHVALSCQKPYDQTCTASSCCFLISIFSVTFAQISEEMSSGEGFLSHFPELRDLTSRVTLLTSEDLAVSKRQDVFWEALHRHLCVQSGVLYHSEEQLAQSVRGLKVQPSSLPAAVKRLKSQRRLLTFGQLSASAVYANTVGWAVEGVFVLLRQVPFVREVVKDSEMRSRLYSMDLIASVITQLVERIRVLPEEERVMYVIHDHQPSTNPNEQFTLHGFFQRCAKKEENEYSNILRSLDPEGEDVLLMQLQSSGYATLHEDKKVVKLHMHNHKFLGGALGDVDRHKLKIRTAVASLDHHLHETEEKMYNHQDEAIARKKKNDVTGALQLLKYSKLRKEQRDKMLASRLRLEEAILAFDTAINNTQVIEAIASATAALKFTREEAKLSADSVDTVMLDFEAELEIQDEISASLPNNELSSITGEEEKALEAELITLMQGASAAASPQKHANSDLQLPSVAGLPDVRRQQAKTNGRKTEQEIGQTSQSLMLA